VENIIGRGDDGKRVRARLPDRRPSISFEFECAGLHYVATISRFADGKLAEIFIGNHKSNSSADLNARDCGVLASIALQLGAPVEVIRNALCPTGPLATALDLIAEKVES